MKQYCDLHTHSVYSDGTWTPAELIREGHRLGLSAMALTDHNTVDGLKEFLNAGKQAGIEAVPGVEFSTDYLGMDLHVVALYVKEECFPRITQAMQEGKRKKDASNRELLENLRKAGFPLDYDAIRKPVPGGQVNRAHIAAAMVKKGWVSDMQEAFRRFLAPELGLYHPPVRPGVLEMITFIRSLGAVPVLAHPFLKLDEAGLRKLIPQAKEAGLLGMETIYVSFDARTTRMARSLAREYSLLESGGSDFHGDNKPGIQIGVGRGNLRVPAEFLEKIRRAAGDGFP